MERKAGRVVLEHLAYMSQVFAILLVMPKYYQGQKQQVLVTLIFTHFQIERYIPGSILAFVVVLNYYLYSEYQNIFRIAVFLIPLK